MKTSRFFLLGLVIFVFAGWIAFSVSVGSPNTKLAAQAGANDFTVTCLMSTNADLIDQNCYTAERSAALVSANVVCADNASAAVGLQLTRDEIVALTPEAPGAGADLLGRAAATVTPTGFLLSGADNLPIRYGIIGSGTNLTPVANLNGFDMTAVAAGENLFAPGDRLGLDFSALPTAAACTVTAQFQGR